MADFSVKHITPKLGGERGARNPNGPTSSYDLVEQMEFLYVKVEKAKNNSKATRITDIAIVEITLGNYKSSTKNLPIGREKEWDHVFNHVFAFDKSKGDVLSVTLKEGQTNTVIGKKSFKIAADIPTRVLPDSPLVSGRYSMFNEETGYHMDLVMSVWFGTQADEVFSQAWFAEAYEISPSCVNDTRPKLYLAPRLCYVRVTIVSGHDLIARDRKRTPSVYVKARLGQFALRTEVKSGSNPFWNQDLIFVASESSMDDTVEISLIDRIDDQHEECIGKLKKIKLSQMAALKLPGSAPVTFHDIEIPDKVEPAGDTRRFSSILRMKLATDQAYHVFDECIQYNSDYRAFAKSLWPGVLGKLEIGILGASGLKLPSDDDPKKGIDSYVVAKYGNKWAKTRTVVNSSSPKWNEQYSFDVYEKCTVFTLGVYDNRNIVSQNQTNDVPIGKVRIPLSRLQWDRLYTSSVPILVLSRGGLKKFGEINIAIRCVRVLKYSEFVTAHFRLMLPKTHYKSPLSIAQIEQLRVQAVQVNCSNLAKTEPPLRNEVVMDILKPKSQSFSMRRTKANYDRVYRIGLMLLRYYLWFDATVVQTTDLTPKGKAISGLICVFLFQEWILWYVLPIYVVFRFAWVMIKYVNRRYLRCMILTYVPPPLIIFDLKMSKLPTDFFDELAEEFDSFPSSERDVDVLRMRYDRLRRLSANVMTFLGDLASQGERFYALIFTFDDPISSLWLWFVCLGLLFFFCCVPYSVRIFIVVWFVYLVKLPWLRNDLPSAIMNFFRRLPTNEDLML